MKLYANSKPFSQVINPFQFDQAFSIHGDNWNLGCVWLHEKPGFKFKVRVLDLAIEREMQNGYFTLTPEKSFLKSWFYGFSLCRSSWKNCSREQRCFFLLVMRAHARQLFSQKQFNFFLIISPKYWLPKVKSHLYSNHIDQQHHTISNRPLNAIFFLFGVLTPTFSQWILNKRSWYQVFVLTGETFKSRKFL